MSQSPRALTASLWEAKAAPKIPDFTKIF